MTVLFYILGLVCGFLIARYFIRKKRGEMKLCDGCVYKEPVMVVENDGDGTTHIHSK